MRSVSGGYPPDEHVLRDLGIWIERDAGGSRAGLEVVPEICNDRRHVRAGALATLVDVGGGESAVHAAGPHWVATSDLVLHVTRPVERGAVRVHPTLLRKTRSTLVFEVALRDAEQEPVGLATMTFAALPTRISGRRMGVGADEPRTEFARPGSGFRAPLVERTGARCLDAAQGVFELRLSPYVVNSLGGLQGGMVALLVDLAAEAAAREATGEPCVTTDLAINYLALGRVGPIRTRARVLRRGPAGALLRVELRDPGADDRLVTVATATAERFA
jgi:uncharacterized protein (TIGR00369 family)